MTSARYPFIHYIVYKNDATTTSLTTAAAAAGTTTPTTTTTTTTQPSVNGGGRTSRDSHKNGRVRNHVHKQIVEITKSHGMSALLALLRRESVALSSALHLSRVSRNMPPEINTSRRVKQQEAQLSHRDRARFMSLNVSLSHSRSFEMTSLIRLKVTIRGLVFRSYVCISYHF